MRIALVSVVASAACGCGFIAGVDFFDLERETDAGSAIADGAADANDEAIPPAADGGRPPRIYVLGGTDDPGKLPPAGHVWTSVIAADGSLGPWAAGSNLPLARIDAPAVVGEDFVAMVGGITPGRGERSNFAIGRSVDGVAASFVESAEAFALPRARAGAIRHGGAVFVLGGVGFGGDVVIASVQHGVVSASGVGVFAASPNLPAPRARMAVAEDDATVYIAGGDDGSTKQTSILMARFAGDDVGTFGAVGTLPSGRAYPQAIVHEKTLLVIGGETERALVDVLVYTRASDGKLSAPIQGMPLPKTTSRHQVVRQGDHVYVIGGVDLDGATATVFVGDLGTDGFVTGWRTTMPLPEPLMFHAAALF